MTTSTLAFSAGFLAAEAALNEVGASSLADIHAAHGVILAAKAEHSPLLSSPATGNTELRDELLSVLGGPDSDPSIHQEMVAAADAAD